METVLGYIFNSGPFSQIQFKHAESVCMCQKTFPLGAIPGEMINEIHSTVAH